MTIPNFSGQAFQIFFRPLLKIISIEHYNEYIRWYSFDIAYAKRFSLQIIINKEGKKQGGVSKF